MYEKLIESQRGRFLVYKNMKTTISHDLLPLQMK